MTIQVVLSSIFTFPILPIKFSSSFRTCSSVTFESEIEILGFFDGDASSEEQPEKYKRIDAMIIE
ncbi:MAG: hypothetical protein WD357_12135 [Gracilimonas sp.]